MGVAVAASCAFLTPIGHKNNTLIMGPGGYGFGDYWRMGLPLELLVVVTAIPVILLVWPLQSARDRAFPTPLTCRRPLAAHPLLLLHYQAFLTGLVNTLAH